MKNTLITTLALLVVVSCTKDKRISNSIERRKGEWTISSVQYTYYKVATDTLDLDLSIESTATDVGTFTFDDYTASWDYTIEGERFKGTGAYIVEDEEITITAVKQDLGFGISDLINDTYDTDDVEITQQISAYVGERKSKTEIQFSSGSEVTQGVSSGIKQQILTGTFVLRR